jgi:hypothetical protein
MWFKLAFLFLNNFPLFISENKDLEALLRQLENNLKEIRETLKLCKLYALLKLPN